MKHHLLYVVKTDRNLGSFTFEYFKYSHYICHCSNVYNILQSSGSLNWFTSGFNWWIF